MLRVFLDANVLFSAAWREGAGLLKLWETPGIRLLTSGHAAEEARRPQKLPPQSWTDRRAAFEAASACARAPIVRTSDYLIF